MLIDASARPLIELSFDVVNGCRFLDLLGRPVDSGQCLSLSKSRAKLFILPTGVSDPTQGYDVYISVLICL